MVDSRSAEVVGLMAIEVSAIVDVVIGSVRMVAVVLGMVSLLNDSIRGLDVVSVLRSAEAISVVRASSSIVVVSSWVGFAAAFWLMLFFSASPPVLSKTAGGRQFLGLHNFSIVLIAR